MLCLCIADTDDGSVGDVDSEKAVDGGDNFDVLSDGEGYSSPFILCAFLFYFFIDSNTEVVMILFMSSFN